MHLLLRGAEIKASEKGSLFCFTKKQTELRKLLLPQRGEQSETESKNL